MSFMKKFLLTAALLLALVVSLTAGTMAAYHQEVATLKSDVTTKVWNIETAPGNTNFVTTKKIAPGDTITQEITLVNQGEVPVDTVLTAKFDSAGKSINGLVFKLEKKSGVAATIDVTTATNGDKKADARLKAKNGDTAEGVKYLLTISWPYNASAPYDPTTNAGKAFTISVNANATSVNESRTDDTPAA